VTDLFINSLNYILSYLFIFIQNTLITAFATRSQIKKNRKKLIPHTLITYSLLRTFLRPNTRIKSTLRSSINKMADPTLLAKARKARFDDLPNFSGHPSEDVERFLKCIKHITKANDESNNQEILEIVRGKLTQSAGAWFDDNEHTFKKWSDFETEFRNRYFSTTIIQKKFDKLKLRKQSNDEPVTSYTDDVIKLCREIDPNMSDPIIIQHLMSGLSPDFKKELSRRESSMNTLKEFLKYAKIEQDLHDTFEKSRTLSLEPSQLYYDVNRSSISSLNTMIEQPRQYYRNMNNMKQENRSSYPTSLQKSVSQRNSIPQSGNRSITLPDKRIPQNTRQFTFDKKQINRPSTLQNKFSNCKICGRTNHRTIDCFYKHTTGCFKCGQQNHTVRDCTLPPNFQ
jgi:Retrotransposon gag protein/Zinc knuckle